MNLERARKDNQLVVWTMRVSITFDLKAMPDHLVRHWESRSEKFGQFLGTVANLPCIPTNPLAWRQSPRFGIDFEAGWEMYAPNPPEKDQPALLYLVWAFDQGDDHGT